MDAHEPQTDVRSYQSAEQEHFGILNASVENGLTSIDLGL
jgi:hypothetical protein